MKNRLIVVLALALVMGLACAAYAEVQNVKVSGDVTAIGAARQMSLGSNTNDGDKSTFMATIVRARVDADLTDNVSATVRILNERYWGKEEFDSSTDINGSSDMSLDLAYVTLKEFLYSPLTLVVGRQELAFGNQMIVGDVDTNNAVSNASAFYGSVATANNDADLSARKAFDAIRATLNYDPLVVDLVMAKINENDLTEDDDVTLYGINANYALNKSTVVEGYYFGKYSGREGVTPNKVDRVDTVGARIATSPVENLTLMAEGALQFGKAVNSAATTTADRRAFAIETAMIYDFKNVKYTPSVMAGYQYFSGQKADDNKRVRAWDPMFENQKAGEIANMLFNQSNAHIACLGTSIKPMDDVTLRGDYFAYWWDKKYGAGQVIASNKESGLVMENNKFAGQEIDLKATYDYTEDVQFNLLGGVLLPGSSFASQNDEIASELVGSMKVTF